jgi:hypothetical protein
MGRENREDGLGNLVRLAQHRALAAANLEVLGLYLSVGQQLNEPVAFGDELISRLAADLASEFPDQRVWTAQSLQWMKVAAQQWPDVESMVAALGNVSWDEVVSYLDRGH